MAFEDFEDAEEIGHNQPPDEEAARRARYIEEHPDLLAARAHLMLAASRLPETIDSDDALAKVNAHVIARRDLASRFEAAREEEKRPIIDIGRSIDGFFGGIRDELRKGAADIEARTTAYLQAKRAAVQAEAARTAVEAPDRQTRMRAEGVLTRPSPERTAGGGGAASLKSEKTYRILDPMALLRSLGPLGSFLTEDAVKGALYRCAKSPNPEVPGVAFYEDEKAKVHASRRLD